MSGIASSSPGFDTASPYISWTDDLGSEQVGDGVTSFGADGPPAACYSGNALWCLHPLEVDFNYGSAESDGPFEIVFPVRVKADTHLTLTIPVSNPDALTYHVSVQVQGW